MSSTTDGYPASILGPRPSAKCLTPQVLSGFASDTRMPRYFFHVRMKQGPVIRDQTGIEFHDLTAARADAAEAVRQTIAEKKAAGEEHDFAALEIADRDGRILSAIEFVDDRSS